MRKFVVISTSITGNDGRCYTTGKEILESQLRRNACDIYVRRGVLKEVFGPTVIDQNRKIKLAIVASIWKRRDILNIFIRGVENLAHCCHENFEISLVISGSIQNDPTFENKAIAFSKNVQASEKGVAFNPPIRYKYIEIPNEPLAAKVNATTYACKDLGVDYVLCMGSDDIISPELLNEYAISMRKGIDFIGVTDCYFYDTVSGKSIYWGGYTENFRKGQPCGAFRALSNRLMSVMDWMPWDHVKNGGLDSTMSRKIKNIPHSSIVFSMRDKKLFAVDIKSETNITKFKLWNNSEFINSKILLNEFPYLKNHE